ncbi:TetR/AcrR family transcriptional regulator [Lacinutrix sp. Hel_I_90]|uniref:TetR/AcrR family transcriptional regulator n=1 Tax=Lacinutrix sp. Hel_I_90 TaxID=1249999 RepID=UPI0005C9B003|nr:TetR/AcrR family transcriptional regulator [Lacinutrix sp. Hel_I_90]
MPKIVAQKIDWLKLGYKTFSEKGFSGIVVEKMSKTLNCNKSSFYWHFKTKKEFIREMVNYWVENKTKKIIEITSIEENPTQKINKLIDLTYRKLPYSDFIFYLKRYAVKDKSISNIIDDVDNQRIDYVKRLLIENGYKDNEAQIKASLLYKHLIGFYEMTRYKELDGHYMAEVKKEILQIIDIKPIKN